MTAVLVRAKQPGYYDGYRKAGDEFLMSHAHFLKDVDCWMEEIKAPVEAAAPAVATPVDEFENMTVADLKQYAQDKGFDIDTSKMKKPELQAAIRLAVIKAVEAKAEEDAAKAEAEAAAAAAAAAALS
jgi:hypothetical protein